MKEKISVRAEVTEPSWKMWRSVRLPRMISLQTRTPQPPNKFLSMMFIFCAPFSPYAYGYRIATQTKPTLTKHSSPLLISPVLAFLAPQKMTSPMRLMAQNVLFVLQTFVQHGKIRYRASSSPIYVLQFLPLPTSYLFSLVRQDIGHSLPWLREQDHYKSSGSSFYNVLKSRNTMLSSIPNFSATIVIFRLFPNFLMILLYIKLSICHLQDYLLDISH